MGCASGSPPWDTSLGGGGSTSVVSTSQAQSSSSVGSGGGEGGSELPAPPYQESDDQGVIYNLDQAFWLVYFAGFTFDEPMDATWDCYNSGTLRATGQIHDDTILNQLDVDMDIEFKNCLIPSSWVQISIIYDGVMHIGGYMDGGPYEDMLTLSGRNMSMRGRIHYEDGHDSWINQHCSFVFLDDFRESQNIGGLIGDICGRHVSLAERDVWSF